MGGFRQPPGIDQNIGAPPPISPSNTGGLVRPNGFGPGGLPNAFVNPNQPQFQYGTPPSRDTPYQIPAQFANVAPGTVITHGHYRYRIGNNGTMTSEGPIPGQPYQIAPEFANQPPGSIVRKGRYRYLLGNDGTMTLYTGPEQENAGPETPRTLIGMVPGERYPLPAEHAGAFPGSVITYQGTSYAVNKDGMMTALLPNP
jgi:hypothetical protein